MAHKLVDASRHKNDYKGAYYARQHYGKPLSLNQSEAFHEPYACRHKEETEILHKKVRNLVYPYQPHQPQLESTGKKEHAYYARRHRNACKPHYQLAKSKKEEKYGTLQYHNYKTI